MKFEKKLKKNHTQRNFKKHFRNDNLYCVKRNKKDSFYLIQGKILPEVNVSILTQSMKK